MKARHATLQRPFEIHVHGDVPLRADVVFAQIQDALKPLWKYAGAKSLADGAQSSLRRRAGHQVRRTGAPAANVLDGAGRRQISASRWTKCA
jgi:hypothetical protein